MATELKPDNNEKLNPGQKHSDDVFDSLTSTPDMQALGDRGNAMIRDQEHAKAPTGGDQVKSVDDLKQGEDVGRSPWKTDMDSEDSDAQPADTSQSRLSGLRSKKGIIGGLGLGGGIVGIAISFSLLLPLKVIGLVDAAAQKMGQEVTHIVAKEGKKLITKAVTHSAGKGDGAFAKLTKFVRTDGFKQAMKDEGVDLTYDSSGSPTLKDSEHPQGATDPATIESDLTSDSAKTSEILDDVLQKKFSLFSWTERVDLLRWMRVKFNASIGTEEKNTNNPEEDAKLAAAEDLASQEASYSDDLSNGISCAIGEGSCDKIEGSDNPDSVPKDTSLNSDVQNSGDQTTSGNTKETGSSSVAAHGGAGDLSGSASKSDLVKKILKAPAAAQDALIKLISEKVFSFLSQDIADEIAKKVVAGPSGPALILSTAVHALGNKTLAKIPSIMKARIYARMFATWRGHADQIKAGEMSPSLVGEFAKQFEALAKDDGTSGLDPANFSDATTAKTFSYISGDNPAKGVALSALVNDRKGDENTFLATTADFFNNNFVGKALKTLADTVNTASNNSIVGWIGQGFGKLVGMIPGVKDALKDMINPFVKWIIALIIGGSAGPNPADTGAKLENDLGAGGTVAYNGWGKATGMRALSDTQMSEQLQIIAKEQSQADARMSLADKLFNANDTRSFVSQLAVHMPSSTQATQVATLTASSLSIIGDIPSMLSSALTQRASAADFSYQDLYGVQPYGATVADLAQPVDQNVLTDTDCPNKVDTTSDTVGDTYNACAVQKSVTNSLVCSLAGTMGSSDVGKVDCSGGDPVPQQQLSATSQRLDPQVSVNTLVTAGIAQQGLRFTSAFLSDSLHAVAAMRSNAAAINHYVASYRSTTSQIKPVVVTGWI